MRGVRPFKMSEDSENDPGQERAQQGRAQAAQASGHPDRCRHPEAGGRGQPLNLMRLVPLENGAAPQKADARGQPLDYPRDLTPGHSNFQRDQHEEGPAHGHQHMGAQARRFPSLLTLATDHCPDQHRRQQSQDRPHEVRGIWDPCDDLCPDKVYSHFILLSPLSTSVPVPLGPAGTRTAAYTHVQSRSPRLPRPRARMIPMRYPEMRVGQAVALVIGDSCRRMAMARSATCWLRQADGRSAGPWDCCNTTRAASRPLKPVTTLVLPSSCL